MADLTRQPLELLAKLNQSLAIGEPWQIVGAFESTAQGHRALEDSRLRAPYPPPGYADTRAVLRFIGEGNLSVNLDLSGYNVAIGGAPARPESVTLAHPRVIQLSLGGHILGTTGRQCLLPSQEHAVTLERIAGRVRLTLDGETLFDVADPLSQQGIVHVSVSVSSGVTVREIRVEGRPAPGEVRPLPQRDTYDLHLTVDLPDDLCGGAAWTEQNFKEVMAFCNENAIKRLYYIYHYGYESGWVWDLPTPERVASGQQENCRETFEAVGDYLPAMVRFAHAAGIEVYAVIKPFENGGQFCSVPFGSEEGKRFGKMASLSGMMTIVSNFLAEHPDCRIERNMQGVPTDMDRRTIRKIVLTAEAGLDAKLDPARIQLWVSENNGGYRPYTGPCQARVESGAQTRIVLDGLDIPENFFAVTAKGEPTQTLGNLLGQLVEVYDENGERLPLSFSDFSIPRDKAFPEVLFIFNMAWRGMRSLDAFVCIDGKRPLGVALGYERYIAGAPCPAYPEAQSWWKDNVEKCLAAGVDGIDFRIAHHNRTLDWPAYGFNQPIVDAFRKRYGVDIRTDSFDREAWRRLHGEFYTDFLRWARKRLNEAGKPMHAHVSGGMGHPAWHTNLEIHFDWPGWIREGLLDGITVKSTVNAPHVAIRAASVARDAGLEINFCPYLNNLPPMPREKGSGMLREMMRQASEIGADSFNLYEHWGFMRRAEDGSLKTICPWLIDVVREKAEKV